uniref:Uncharacterized protein n=1 Tax=Solanum tuberosum TaxID=4113 RepID=M1DRC6_SOLTU
MGFNGSYFLDDHTQVPRISIQHAVDPDEHSRVSVVQKCAAKDHSAQLVGIADPLGDPPFGLVHLLSALAFNKFKFKNIGRWSTASRNRSATDAYHD